MADSNVERRTADRERGLAHRSQDSSFARRGAFPNVFNRPDDLFSMSPFTLMRRLTEDMDRMFSDMGGSGSALQETGAWAPAVEVREQNGNLIVSAELPGIDQNNVKVQINDDALVIQGERKREWQHEDRGVHRSERSYGSFYRAIPLPDGAKTDQAKAEFRNGVLEVRVPVPASQQRTREIPIDTGAERKQVGTETTQQKTQTSKAG